jgi:hypothetical protein
VTHLFLVDTRRGLLEAKKRADHDSRAEIVVLSAEAMEAAERLGGRFRVAADLGASRTRLTAQTEVFDEWAAALSDLEARLSAGVPGFQFDAPGVLSSRAYSIAFAINAVRFRAELMSEAVNAMQPQLVTVVETDIYPTFRNDGYRYNPWTVAFDLWCQSRRIQADLVSVDPAGPRESSQRRVSLWARATLRRAELALAGMRSAGAANDRTLTGLRLLFSDAVDYDWYPVAKSLRRRGAKISVLRRQDDGSRVEDASYLEKADAATRGLGGLPELTLVQQCYREWALEVAGSGRLVHSGIDSFQALSPYLYALVLSGPSLLARTDAVVHSVLDQWQPHAVFFSAIVCPHQKRLVIACNRRAIPTICYQHGGAYGTHDVPVHDFAEGRMADYFLSYGSGVLPPISRRGLRRAHYVAVGSARIEQQMARKRNVRPNRDRRLRVVFAGDVSFRNTLTAGTEIEDTFRYKLEREVLTELALGPRLQVVYRPFPADLSSQGTPAWLSRARLDNVSIDASSRTAALLRRSELLITLSTSGTLWNEALALGVPLVAYLDSRFTSVREEYFADLRNACIVCTSAEELRELASSVATEGREFLRRFVVKRPDVFLQRYVLADGLSSDKVSDFVGAALHARLPQALAASNTDA